MKLGNRTRVLFLLSTVTVVAFQIFPNVSAFAADPATTESPAVEEPKEAVEEEKEETTEPSKKVTKEELKDKNKKEDDEKGLNRSSTGRHLKVGMGVSRATLSMKGPSIANEKVAETSMLKNNTPTFT